MSFSPITSMPNEILSHIFSQLEYSDLGNLQGVSKKFREVATHLIENYKKQFRLRGFGIEKGQIEGSFIFRMANANRLLTQLKIVDCEKITSQDLSRVFSVLKYLRRVHLEGDSFFERDAIKKLIQTNSHLQELTLIDRTQSKRGEGAPLFAIIRYQNNLRTLSVSLPNKEFKDDHLQLIMGKIAEKLDSFTFHSASGLKLEHIRILSESASSLKSCSLTVSLTKKEYRMAREILISKGIDKKNITLTPARIAPSQR